MSRRPPPKSLRSIGGFSLIELLISIAIGLIITIAAIAAYIGASGASKVTDAQSRMNEDAQAALSVLSQQLRMSGANPEQNNRVGNANPQLSSEQNPVYLPTPTYAGFAVSGGFTLSDFSIRGCDGKFTNVASTSETIDSLTCTGGTNTLPDSIAVTYEADQYNTARANPADCVGATLTSLTATVPVITYTNVTSPATTSSSAVSYRVAENRFYIGTSTFITSPSLYCKGNGGSGASTQQPLVENVEDLQFLYGTVSTSTTATTATVGGYLTADQVNGLYCTYNARGALGKSKNCANLCSGTQ